MNTSVHIITILYSTKFTVVQGLAHWLSTQGMPDVNLRLTEVLQHHNTACC